MSTEVTSLKKYQELVKLRESWQQKTRFLPEFLHDRIQQIITNASGIPYQGQHLSTSTFALKPLIEDALFLVIGIALSFLAACHIQNNSLALIGLLAGYAVATRGICGLIMVDAHHLSHGLGTGNKLVDEAIGNIISIVTITHPFSIYKAGHLNHHREAPNLKDFDAQQILNWGFVPGKPVEAYWQLFWQLILSPIEHLKTAKARIQGQFKPAENSLTPALLYQIATLSYWMTSIGVASYAGYLLEYSLSIIPPIIIGLQIGVAIEWIPRHQWFATDGAATINKAIFLYPKNEPNLFNKLLLDFTVRSLFIRRDLSLHAYHHHIIHRKWVNTAQEVQKLEAKALVSGKSGQFEYALGYENALNIVFEHLSHLPAQDLSQTA